MGGFYGNILNSNKTNFSFDKIYSNRYDMENAIANDQIFIGRFVLIEYDRIYVYEGYYNGVTGMMCDDLGQINGVQQWRESVKREYGPNGTRWIYKDLNIGSNKFYIYVPDSNQGHYEEIDYNGIPYSYNYNIDVQEYGRGYDSTVWMKYYDAESNQYKYIMIVELNAVPAFHLISDPPSMVPYGPYFDNNSTNLTYNMHVMSPWGIDINTLENIGSIKSDVDITKKIVTVNDDGTITIDTRNNIPADIYFNKKGFDKTEKHFIDNDTMANEINYEFHKSGKTYYGTDGSQGVQSDDTLSWYIHLPVIGNTISDVWDIMYGTNRKQGILNENWSNYELCTIDDDSVLGIINGIHCYLGKIDELNAGIISENPITLSSAYNGDDIYGYQSINHEINLATNSFYIYTTAEGTIPPQRSRSFIFVNNTVNDVDIRTYYLPSYANLWKEDENGEYYYDSIQDVYRLANKNIVSGPYYRPIKRTIGGDHLKFNCAYTGGGTLLTNGEAAAMHDYNTRSEEVYEPVTTIYGAIALTNKILGIGLDSKDSRDERTVVGLMNRMKDLIENIDTQLQPNQIVITNNLGVMTTKQLLACNLTTYDYNQRYWYDNCVYPLNATDTLGQALVKIEYEIDDLRYIPLAIEQYTANQTLIENGQDMTNLTFNYEVNTTPWKNLNISYTTPHTDSFRTVYNVNIESLFIEPPMSDSITIEDGLNWNNQFNDTEVDWTLRIIDGRDKIISKTIPIKWTDKYYYWVGPLIYDIDNEINTYSDISNNAPVFQNLRSSLSEGTPILELELYSSYNNYIYYMQPEDWGPSYSIQGVMYYKDPIFKLDGFEGGMDFIGTIYFTNSNNYGKRYRVWKSTNKNLGRTILSVMRRE